MKVPLSLRLAALVMLGWIAAGAPANAQTFGLSVSSPPTTVLTNSSLTYTLFVTNETFLSPTVFVTNTLTGPATITTATPISFLFQSNESNVVFRYSAASPGQINQFIVTAQASAAGSLTNTITVAAPFSFTNTVTTNVVTEVTNAIPVVTEADLAVAVTGPAQAVITNDYFTYGVTVSNLGPSSAAGVLVSNTYSMGISFIDIWPTNVPHTITNYAVTNGVLQLSLGTLGSGVVTNVYLRVEETNAGPLTLSASVGADTPDPNTTNNTASTSITVTNYLSGLLSVTLAATQTFNPQNGLMEQPIVLSNVGPAAVAAARVVLSGLTPTNWLFNAAGTNAAGTNSLNPFVYYAGALDTNQNVSLLLQYFVPTGLPFDLSTNQVSAFEVPPVNLTPPSNLGTQVGISRVLQLPSGSILVEFASTLDAGYTVIYSDNSSFTNPMVVMPPVTAPANRVQWIDYGPPATVSHAADTNSRFYRVYLNP